MFPICESLDWQLYVGEGEVDLARDAFDRARSANPTLPIPWAGMAFVHSFMERCFPSFRLEYIDIYNVGKSIEYRHSFMSTDIFCSCFQAGC